ncbi:MAG: acyl-CoA thioesterase [Pseudomonadota bacterium]
MIHTIDIKVRGYHLDVFGHVNNARYLEFLEEARWAALEKTLDLLALSREGYAFTVVNININYRRPAVLNEMLCVETELTRCGKRSAVIHQAVKLKGTGTMVADADVTFVMYDTEKQSAALLEGGLLELLQAL